MCYTSVMNKVCEFCSEAFNTPDSRKRFCNRSCSASYNNKGRNRHGRVWPKCKGCDRTACPDENRNGYCSTECRHKDEVNLWLAGKLNGNRKYTHASYVKRYLEERSGLICEMPDCNESRKRANGSHILQVDHIDGDWRNNKVENLRMICPSCHALTETWGAGNMGKGRKWKKSYSQF